jgi:hypothetical protein
MARPAERPELVATPHGRTGPVLLAGQQSKASGENRAAGIFLLLVVTCAGNYPPSVIGSWFYVFTGGISYGEVTGQEEGEEEAAANEPEGEKGRQTRQKERLIRPYDFFMAVSMHFAPWQCPHGFGGVVSKARHEHVVRVVNPRGSASSSPRAAGTQREPHP